jgi:glycosyltransferase involved in cell wall biosynthesis
MNVGIVTTWFERGAAYVSRQYRDVLSVEHEVFIYARGGESFAIGDPRWDDGRVTWAKKCFNPLPTSVDLKDFENWIQRNRLDVVFFNEQHWWEPVLTCRRLGVISGAYIDYYTEQTVPYFGCYDFLVCNTRRHYSVFDWHPQCFYAPWGTDIDLFAMTVPDPVAPGCVTFFHSGGVSPNRKGCDLVIQAFAQIEGPARLVLHAQQKLKRFFPELAGLISRLEAEGRLQCHEETVPAPGLYHLGDVYVYPTRLEGIGLTMPEASACGLPVIATACGPMTEFVEHGINGRHVAVERYVARSDGYYWPQALVSVQDLATQMRWYVDHVSELASLKRDAREYAVSNFCWKKNAQGIAKIFNAVHRLDSVATAQVADEVSEFERKRAQTHKLSRYLRLRAMIEYRYPHVFHVISSLLTVVRAPFNLGRH